MLDRSVLYLTLEALHFLVHYYELTTERNHLR